MNGQQYVRDLFLFNTSRSLGFSEDSAPAKAVAAAYDAGRLDPIRRSDQDAIDPGVLP